MGTNYYARYSPCPTCGRCSAEKHIGKLSAGWRFLFQAHRDISSYSEWKDEFDKKGIEIYDEYNDKVPPDDFKKMIEMNYENPRMEAHAGEGFYIDSDGYDFTWREFS
jgi:hypothetical protein